jgi:hypothetical protein
MKNVSKLQRKSEHTFYVQELFSQKLLRLRDNVEQYGRAREATDDNTAHAHCVRSTYGYEHTLRIFNTCCFSAATMVRTRPIVICTFIACLVAVQAFGRLGCVTGWHSCCCCCCCAFVSCTDCMTGVSRCCVKMANSRSEMSHSSRNRCSLTYRLKCVTPVMILVCLLGHVKFVLSHPFGDQHSYSAERCS